MTQIWNLDLTYLRVLRYGSPNYRVIKSRRIRWAVHVAHKGEERRIQGFGGETWVKETTWETQA